MKCIYPGCTNTYYKTKSLGNDITYHRFPKNKKLYDSWKKAINRKMARLPTRHESICSEHFAVGDEDFSLNLCRLKENAVPIKITVEESRDSPEHDCPRCGNDKCSGGCTLPSSPSNEIKREIVWTSESEVKLEFEEEIDFESPVPSPTPSESPSPSPTSDTYPKILQPYRKVTLNGSNIDPKLPAHVQLERAKAENQILRERLKSFKFKINSQTRTIKSQKAMIDKLNEDLYMFHNNKFMLHCEKLKKKKLQTKITPKITDEKK